MVKQTLPKIKSHSFWGYLALFLLLLGIYSPSLQFDKFVYDAGPVLERNTVIQGDWSFHKVFTTDYWGRGQKKSIGSYRPIAVSELWIEYRVWGKNPAGYAFTQILWMFAICILLIILAKRLGFTSQVAWIAGFFFAVHPIHTDIVASVAGRADLLAAFFLLVGLLLHLHKKAIYKNLAPLALLMGLGCKEFIVIFPFVTFAMDVFTPQRSPQRFSFDSLKQLQLPWLRYLSYILSCGLFFFVRVQATGVFMKFPYGLIDNPLLGESTLTRWLNVPSLLGKYLQLLLAPISLSANRTYNAVPVLHSPWDLHFWLGFAAILFFSLSIWFWRQKPKRLFLLAFFALCYFPLSNTLIVSTSIMADRWLFMASIPFCIFVPEILVPIINVKKRFSRIAYSSTFLFILLLGFITFDYTQHWRSSLTLFRYASQNAPNSLKARYIYGKELYTMQRYQLAAREFKAATKIKPDFPYAQISLSESYEKMGQLKKAESVLHKAHHKNPREKAFLFQLYILFKKQGKDDEAEKIEVKIKKLKGKAKR